MNNKTNRSVPSWWTLDNAAKIFPSTGSSHDSKVFRFVCELQETVNPQILQTAREKGYEFGTIDELEKPYHWPNSY